MNCQSLGEIEMAPFFHHDWQLRSQTKEVDIPMPYSVWECLMTPALTIGAGGSWSTSGSVESLFVEKEGLGQLDYLFGVTTPHFYNWKFKVFALGSRCEIDSIRLSYDVDLSILTCCARHEMAL